MFNEIATAGKKIAEGMTAGEIIGNLRDAGILACQSGNSPAGNVKTMLVFPDDRVIEYTWQGKDWHSARAEALLFFFGICQADKPPMLETLAGKPKSVIAVEAAAKAAKKRQLEPPEDLSDVLTALRCQFDRTGLHPEHPRVTSFLAKFQMTWNTASRLVLEGLLKKVKELPSEEF